MTTETDVKQRLAALRTTLAEAMNPDGSRRFTGFRPPELCDFCGGTARPPPEGVNEDCEDCDDTGLQGGAGGMAGALAGLTAFEGHMVLHKVREWVGMNNQGDDPMPSEVEIDVKALELVCQVKGMEVPDAPTMGPPKLEVEGACDYGLPPDASQRRM